MTMLKILLIISGNIMCINCIWPPPYKIDLKQSEEFIIGDYEDSDDEMIQNMNLDKDKDKFNLLHKQVKYYNNKKNNDQYKTYHVSNSEDYYNENIQPLESGFIDNIKNVESINSDNKNVYYLNKLTNQLVAAEIKHKRSEQEEDYDYEQFNNEYNLQIKSNEILFSNRTSEHESVKDTINMMINFKDPKNCTAEELRGIGFEAIKCAWMDVNKSESKEKQIEVFYRIKRIILIWIFIYIAIAIPCWCHKGWCCCCFQCKFCKPRERIDEAKKYYVENKPGEYNTKDGEIITYEPTIYEIDAYLKLECALMKI